MCRQEIIRYFCGHHLQVAKIEKCPLTIASENFKTCSIPGDWPKYNQGYCAACCRAQWNFNILEAEAKNRNWLADIQRELQNAGQVELKCHEEAASQDIDRTAWRNTEQQCGVNEKEIERERESLHQERVAEGFGEPTTENPTHHALNLENLVRMIQFGDMEAMPYHAEQHISAAVRSDYKKTSTGVSVFWEFNPCSASSSNSTTVEYLGYTSLEGALAAEPSAGELHQRGELEKNAIGYTPDVIKSLISRPRSNSYPSIFTHERSMLQFHEG